MGTKRIDCQILQYIKLFLLFGLLLLSHVTRAQYQSKILQLTDNNRLVYHSDVEGNRIPDFSFAGYRNGEEALPVLPVKRTLDPISGDNTAHIQAALDEVASLEPDANGFRGAVLLNPGNYPIHGTIKINASGVVLRGSGDNDDPLTSTILQGIGTDRRTLIVVGYGSNSKWGQRVSGSTANITSKFIPAGSRTIQVDDASKFAVGDNIIIIHPSDKEWIDAVGGGETHGDVKWQPGEIDMYFNRFITRIEGNKIQFKTPLYDNFDRNLSKPFVYIYTRENLVLNSGVEDLRIKILTSGPFAEDHVWNAIDFIKVEDCWARNVTALHFGKSGFWLEEANRCTILNCQALEPHSEIAAPDRYNFYLGECSNNILFKGCHASEARHAFVSNGTASVSGIVFTSCSSVDEYTSSESHRRWGEGLLWDNTTFRSQNTDRVLGFYNRGSWGTGHGWTGTNQVAWNVSAPINEIVVQKPPIGQNYAIGCEGNITHIGPFNPHPEGWIEGTGENLLIPSLYEAQLTDRLTNDWLPDAPGNFRPTAYEYANGSGSVTLEWTDVALDETHYILERSADNANTFEVLANLGADTEMYIDADFQQEDYFYRLTAVNNVGASAYSAVINAMSYDPLDTLAVTFRVNMREITDLYPGGAVWLLIANDDNKYVMHDDDNNNIYELTMEFLEFTDHKYQFAYQDGVNPDTDIKVESIIGQCRPADGYRTLAVEQANLILPPIGFAGCDELLPAGEDITDIGGTTIIGSNDNEPWIDGSTGAGSPPGERVDKLIDNDIQTKYLVRAIESWIEVSADTLSVLGGYTITSANDVPERDPRSWKLLGLEEETEQWILLHEVTGNPVWTKRYQPRSWQFANNKEFRTYRLEISEINGDSQGLMQMAELQLFGEKLEPVILGINELDQGISIYPNPSNGQFTINCGGTNSFEYIIRDLRGNLITGNRVINQSEVSVNLTNLDQSVYILTITTDKRRMSIKVLLR